ncbi:MAG TPA: PD-(D/E)XK nuclease family protein, partial [Ktedonobacterales bacterium]|nr:PD-(D/E)XK nuclease family protein [Ktedonobacterales bacterium]
MREDEVLSPTELEATEADAEEAPQVASSALEGLALSHSQVEIFQQCPRRWWLLKRTEVSHAPSEALILGHAVHQAIEADLTDRLKESAAPATLETLNQTFEQALAARLTEDDPDELLGEQQRAALRAQGSAVLAAYSERVARQVNPVEVEVEFAFTHPDDPTITFAGRMDAITERAGWGRTIVDWKVTRRPWREGEEHRRIQADAYLWADQQRLLANGGEPLAPSERVTFVTFPPAAPGPISAASGKGADPAGTRIVDIRTTSRTPGQLRAYAGL